MDTVRPGDAPDQDADGGERGDYLEPYRAAVARHGATFGATLWGSERSQILRFDVMIDLVGFDDCALLDVGCGPGAFASRLHERGVGFRQYHGIDALPELAEGARKLGLDRCTFAAADPIADPAVLDAAGADWICYSGTLNTMDDATVDALLEQSFAAAAQGIAFNFLSNRFGDAWRDRDLTPARRFDTLRRLDWAFARTSRVAFTQAYLDGHDATIVMWH